jgi:hypothetical protein
MNKLQRLELIKDMIQEAVDRGARSIEQINQYVADLPFEALERAGLLDDEKLKLREKKARTIGMVYDAIRGINKQIGELISDQIENLEDGKQVAEVLKKKAQATRPVRRKSRKPAQD